MVGLAAEDEDTEQKVVAIPELRGGLLPHVLKKITEVTGVYSCDLERFDDGAQVLIAGPRGRLTDCSHRILRAAVGDFQDLPVVELVQKVGGKKLLRPATNGEAPLQVIGRLTGCDLTVDGGHLQIQGPSMAIAKGAMKMVDRFLASDSDDVNEVLQVRQKDAPSSKANGSDIQDRATPHRPQWKRSSKNAEERFVEIPNLSRMRLLTCKGALINKLQEQYAVHVKVLDNKDYPGVPKDCLPLRIKGSPDNIADCEGSLWQMSQDDFSSVGFILTQLRLPRGALQILTGNQQESRLLNKMMTSWREVLCVDATCNSDKGADQGPVVEISLCGDSTKIMALKAAVCIFGPLLDRSDTMLAPGLANSTKLLKEILQEVIKHNLAIEDGNNVPQTGDKREASALQKHMKSRGADLLDSLGLPAVLELLGLVGRRLSGMLKDYVAPYGGHEKYAEDLVIDCEEVKLAISDGTIFIPKSQSSGLRLGESVTFRLLVVEDLTAGSIQLEAAELEHAAWHPPPAQPGLMRGPAAHDPHAPDQLPPVIEVRTDDMGRRYFWNHQERTSDWVAPPPHIGYWQRQMDFRSGRHFYFNPGTQKSLWELPVPKAAQPSQLPPSFSQPSLLLRPEPGPEPTEAAAEDAPPGDFGAAVRPSSPRRPKVPSPSRPPRMPRIPPTRRPEAEGATREEEQKAGGTQRIMPSAAVQHQEEYREDLENLSGEMGATALDAMIDEQTELDAIVHANMQTQEEHLEEDEAALAGDSMLEEDQEEHGEEEHWTNQPHTPEFFHPYAEGEEPPDFAKEEAENEQETWPPDEEEEIEVEAEEAASKPSRQIRSSGPDEEPLDDGRAPLRRRKRKVEMLDQEEGWRSEQRFPQPPEGPPPRRCVPAPPPPLTVFRAKPEEPKEPPSWWHEEAEAPKPEPPKPPEPPGPPGPPPGPPPERSAVRRVVTVNVVKLPSTKSRERHEEEDDDEHEKWREKPDVPEPEAEQVARSSHPWRDQSPGSQGQDGGDEEAKGRKRRLVKSWDSRKKEFVYKVRYEDEPKPKSENQPKQQEGVQDSQQWADDWNNSYRETYSSHSRWAKQTKDSKKYSYRRY